MDAFYGEARHRQGAAASSGAEPVCSFCLGASSPDGCLGWLGGIDRAVLEGRWDEPGTLLDEYVAWVNGLGVEGSPGQSYSARGSLLAVSKCRPSRRR